MEQSTAHLLAAVGMVQQCCHPIEAVSEIHIGGMLGRKNTLWKMPQCVNVLNMLD